MATHFDWDKLKSIVSQESPISDEQKSEFTDGIEKFKRVAAPPAEFDANELFRTAAFRGHRSIVLYLLDVDLADVNGANDEGFTALHEAAYGCKDAIVGILLAGGASVNRQSSLDHGHKSALHRALESTPSDDGVNDGDNESRALSRTVAMLLSNGANRSLPCSRSRTPLHYAAGRGSCTVVGWLLEHEDGATYQKKDKDGNLPLHEAARMAHYAVVGLILDRTWIFGVNAFNNRGETPLLLATWSTSSVPDMATALEHRQIRTVECLLQHGAFVSEPLTVDGHTYSSLVEVIDEGPRPVPSLSILESIKARKRTEDAQMEFHGITYYLTDNTEPNEFMEQSVYSLISGARALPHDKALRWIHIPVSTQSWVMEIMMQYLSSHHPQLPVSSTGFHPSGLHAWLNTVRVGSEMHCNLRPRASREQFAYESIFVSMPYLGYDRLEDSMIYKQIINKGLSLSDSPRRLPQYMEKYKLLAEADPETLKQYSRRTLDEYHYHPRLSNKRDMSQVTVRMTQGYPLESECLDRFRSLWWPGAPDADPRALDGEIVLVDGLSLWVLGPQLVITCSDEPFSEPGLPCPFRALKDRLSTSQLNNAYDLAGVIIQECAITNPTKNATMLKNFRNAIGQTADIHLQQFRDFIGASVDFERLAVNPERNPEAVKRASDEVASTESAIKNLCEVADIIEELDMMRGIIMQQLDVVDDYLKVLTIQGVRASKVDALAAAIPHLIKRGQASIDLIAGHARRTHAEVLQLLDLKQKQATVMESRFARWQAESTARQGNTIMVFTVVTILFLPASFMAAFFAIPNITIPGVDIGGIGFVVGIIAAVTLTISMPLVFIAFHATEARQLLSRVRPTVLLRHHVREAKHESASQQYGLRSRKKVEEA